MKHYSFQTLAVLSICTKIVQLFISKPLKETNYFCTNILSKFCQKKSLQKNGLILLLVLSVLCHLFLA